MQTSPFVGVVNVAASVLVVVVSVSVREGQRPEQALIRGDERGDSSSSSSLLSMARHGSSFLCSSLTGSGGSGTGSGSEEPFVRDCVVAVEGACCNIQSGKQVSDKHINK